MQEEFLKNSGNRCFFSNCPQESHKARQKNSVNGAGRGPKDTCFRHFAPTPMVGATESELFYKKLLSTPLFLLNGAGRGNRTLVTSLEGSSFTTKLFPPVKSGMIIFRKVFADKLNDVFSGLFFREAVTFPLSAPRPYPLTNRNRSSSLKTLLNIRSRQKSCSTVYCGDNYPQKP